MTNTVDDYLERLDAALGRVAYATAREIRAGIAEELSSLDPAAADERMRELGDPAGIAAAAAGEARGSDTAGPSWAASGGGAPTALGAAMLTTGVLGSLALFSVTRNPIGAGLLAMLAVAGVVVLVVRAVSRR